MGSLVDTYCSTQDSMFLTPSDHIDAYTGTKEGETVEDYICNQKFTGCRIDYKSRECVMEETVGCTNPFPYQNMVECLNDFHGRCPKL